MLLHLSCILLACLQLPAASILKCGEAQLLEADWTLDGWPAAPKVLKWVSESITSFPFFFRNHWKNLQAKRKENTLAPVSCCTCGGIIGLASKRVVLTDSSHVWLTWKALELDQPTVEVEEPWWQDLCSITKNQDVFRLAASNNIVPQINGSSRGSTSSILCCFSNKNGCFFTIYFDKIMDKHRIKVRLLRSTQEWRVELELVL